MKKFLIIFILFFLLSCNKTPCDKIIYYAKEKFGDDFKEGVIDLKDVFDFEWKKLYVFSPLTYPEDVTKEVGFKYEGQIVKDDNYLFLFVNDSNIVKQYTCYRSKIGFSDDNNTGVYKIVNGNAKYKVKLLSKDNYWLYRIN